MHAMVKVIDGESMLVNRCLNERGHVKTSNEVNVALILKELPILGEASVVASRFAIAVKQLYGADAYKQVHDALFSLPGQPTPAAFRPNG